MNISGRSGSAMFVVVLLIVVALAAGSVWYYEANKNIASQPIGVSTTQDINSVTTTTAPTATTSVSSTQSPTQSSAIVPNDWKLGKVSYTSPVSGCFAFDYPPTFSVSGDPTNYYDQNGDTLQFWVNPVGGSIQQIDQEAAAAGYTVKDFTTIGGFPGRETVLKGNPTQFFILTAAGPQQVAITLVFDHESNMPPSSLSLSTEETMAQSVVDPCSLR
jgi:hypothetical protein